MSDQKPKLKLKFGGPKKSQEAQEQGPPATPQSATASTPKITLKFGSTSAATPSTPKATPPPPLDPKPSKSGRKPKPTAKKRTLDTAQIDDNADDYESDSEPLAKPKPSSSSSHPPVKKLKITTGGSASASAKRKQATATGRTPTTAGPTNIKFKKKGKVPDRPLGVGYDSEASDREDDPTIHENLILRMLPGDDCDYLRAAIANNTLGDYAKSKVSLRFMTSDGRRASLTIRERRYAAVLVDLPCIVEAMKSWNKKEFYKSADICQMLLVLGRVATDEEAITYDLQRAIAVGEGVVGRGELDEKTWAWAHGLTPPMRWVRKRRFRKRISTKVVEEDEREVERLLEDDADAKGGFTYRHVDLDALEREQAEADEEEYDDYDDADGDAEEGYDMPAAAAGGEAEDDDDDDDLEAHLEAEMLKQAHEGDLADISPAPPYPDLMDATSPPQTQTTSQAATPSFSAPAAVGTPTSTQHPPSSDDPSNISDSDSSDAGDSPPAGPDDAAVELQQDRQRTREEIADLEAAIAREEQRLKVTPNQILKQKIARTIQGLKADLEVKLAAGGDGGGEGGDEVDGDGDG